MSFNKMSATNNTSEGAKTDKPADAKGAGPSGDKAAQTKQGGTKPADRGQDYARKDQAARKPM